MSRNVDSKDIDAKIKSYYSDIKVDEDLKASTMQKIKMQQKELGVQERSSEFSVVKPRKWITFLVAASLVFALIGVGGNAFYHTETAYASVDGAQTVELGVNWFGKVIDAKTENKAAQNELSKLDLRGRNYEDAILILADSDLLGETEVDISVQAKGERQKGKLEKSTKYGFENAGKRGTCNGKKFGKNKHKNNDNQKMNQHKYERQGKKQNRA